MSHIIWEDSFSVNVEEIDKQHKELIKIINCLLDMSKLRNEELIDKMKRVADKLKQYVIVHFATEEKYFKEFNFEKSKEHIVQHEFFNKKVAAFEKEFENNNLKSINEMIVFISNWFMKHVQGDDKEYVRLFNENGLK